MLAGHIATALVARQKVPRGPIVYFLVAALLQDLLWIVFHYLGLEPTEPADIFAVSLETMTVNMLYSHDLVPQVVWAGLFFVAGRVLFKSTAVGLAGAALVLGHFVLDLVSGFPHYVFGPETPEVGFGFYHTNVNLAIAIETVFTAAVVVYVFREERRAGTERTTANKLAITGMLAFGIVFFLVVGSASLRELFGIPEIDVPVNTTILSLVATFAGMIAYFSYFASPRRGAP